MLCNMTFIWAQLIGWPGYQDLTSLLSCGNMCDFLLAVVMQFFEKLLHHQHMVKIARVRSHPWTYDMTAEKIAEIFSLHLRRD